MMEVKKKRFFKVWEMSTTTISVHCFHFLIFLFIKWSNVERFMHYDKYSRSLPLLNP